MGPWPVAYALRAIKIQNVSFNPKLKTNAFLPSSSSLASSSAFLSLSCIITRLATDAKVHFLMGAVEEVAGAAVEAVGEVGESVGALQAELVDVKEVDVSFEMGEILGVWGLEQLEVTSGVLFVAGEVGLVDTGLDVGLEAGVEDFDPSAESIGLEMMIAGVGEE